MIFLLILIFIVFPILLIYFASSDGSSSEKDSSSPPDDDFTEESYSYSGKNKIHLPAKKDIYDNYSDDVYDYALDMDPEELREEDPDLYDDIYGWKANNPDEN